MKSIVVASSDKAYGDQEELPYDEDTPLEGRHPYDVSKCCADLIAQTYAKTYGLPVAITRCGNFYGGGDLNWNRIVPGTIRSRAARRAAGHPLRRPVRPRLFLRRRRRGGLHAAGRAAARAARTARAGVQFSNEIQVTVLELVQRILQLMGSTLEPDVRNEASNEIRHQYLSARRARTDARLGAAVHLEQGLERTIAWYREFLRMTQRADELRRADSRPGGRVLRRGFPGARLRPRRTARCPSPARSSTPRRCARWWIPRSISG